MSPEVDRLKAALADRYLVQHEIGHGGMATVYLAQDLRHDRPVAIKVLKPQLAGSIGSERFLREIRLASKLQHPHILPIYDSGEADGLLYYVMPYVEGESLRERLDREKQLSIEDAVRITREVSEALDYAHGRGVIHRDIKPANILLSAGQAVVADFGIARAVEEAGGETLTQTGIALGTPAYMSPELGLEGDADARADIYALGCVLYEMLGGDVPFPGATGQAILARKAVEPVPSLRVVRETVPVAVEDLVTKTLARVPADRFATAGQLTEALEGALTSGPLPTEPARRLAGSRAVVLGVLLTIVLASSWWVSKTFTGAPARIASLAVLPFTNLSGNPEEEYFVAGMHDALIRKLAQIGALRVISRRSAMRYKESDKSVPEIARELNVDGIVEASVVRAGDSVHLQVDLIQAFPEERDLWAQEYDRDVSDVLAMHSDVARTIAEKIDVAMTPEEETRLGGARTVNPETYEAYLRGMYHLNKSTPEDVRKGLAYLHEALDKNPADPMANAGLALGYATVGHGPAPPPDAWPRARAAAERALKLDSTLAEAHAAMADVKLYYEWDWTGAEQAFLRANELNPNLAMNHFHHAWYLALVGRLDEAIVEHERAQKLDPLTPAVSANLGWLYLYAGRTDAALTESQKAIDLDPNSAWGFLTLGTAYSFKGMYEESIAALEQAVAISPLWKWALGRGYALAGRRDEARKIAAELEAQETNSMGALGLVVLYTALGENDAAFRWLAYEPPHAWVPWLAVDPVLVPPRDDPRFQDFLRRLKLPPRPE